MWQAGEDLARRVREDARFARPGEDCVVVKEGPARRVWRFECEGIGEVFVKECLVPDLRDRLKYLFRPPKAFSEHRTLVRLREAGIPAPEPLAVASKRNGAFLESSILVTRSLGDVVPLGGYVLERIDAATHAETAAFTERFARFVRGLHDAGVRHRDFHASNVMVASNASAFHLVDVDGVSMGGSLTANARLANLSVIGHFFCRVVPRHWRLRFLKAHLGADADWRAAARSVECRAERGMRKIWASRDRRILGQNKYFRHVRVGNLIGHRRRTREALAAVRLFEKGDPCENTARTLKSSRSSEVAVIDVEAEGTSRPVCCKRRNTQRGWKALFDPFRMSRGKRGFLFGAAFENRHLPTPHVLAALDERRRCCLSASFLLTEYIDGAENLAAVLTRRKESPLYSRLIADKPSLIERLAGIIRQMHWCGFSMRDLKAANILVYEREGRLDFMLIDLDGVRFYPRGVPREVAARNLGRLYFDVALLGAVSRREALSFLRRYLGHARCDRIVGWLGVVYQSVRRKRVSFRAKGAVVQTQTRRELTS